MDLKKIDTILNLLGDTLFPNFEYTISLPDGLKRVIESEISTIGSGNLGHFTYKKKDLYLTKIKFKVYDLSCITLKESKEKLVDIFKNKNVKIIYNERMKLVVDTKSFLKQYDGLLNSHKTINKFNL